MSTACRKAAGEAFSVEMLALVTLCRVHVLKIKSKYTFEF